MCIVSLLIELNKCYVAGYFKIFPNICLRMYRLALWLRSSNQLPARSSPSTLSYMSSGLTSEASASFKVASPLKTSIV